MKVIFFSQDDDLKNIIDDIGNDQYLYTDSFDELKDLVEDEGYVLFIDYDYSKRKVAEKVNKLYLDDSTVVRIIISESMSLKEIRKHQNSKKAAHGYLHKPLDHNIIDEMVQEFIDSHFQEDGNPDTSGQEEEDEQSQEVRNYEQQDQPEEGESVEEMKTKEDFTPLDEAYDEAGSLDDEEREKTFSRLEIKLDDLVRDTLSEHREGYADSKKYNRKLNDKIQNIFDEGVGDSYKEKTREYQGMQEEYKKIKSQKMSEKIDLRSEDSFEAEKIVLDDDLMSDETPAKAIKSDDDYSETGIKMEKTVENEESEAQGAEGISLELEDETGSDKSGEVLVEDSKDLSLDLEQGPSLEMEAEEGGEKMPSQDEVSLEVEEIHEEKKEDSAQEITEEDKLQADLEKSMAQKKEEVIEDMDADEIDKLVLGESAASTEEVASVEEKVDVLLSSEIDETAGTSKSPEIKVSEDIQQEEIEEPVLLVEEEEIPEVVEEKKEEPILETTVDVEEEIQPKMEEKEPEVVPEPMPEPISEPSSAPEPEISDKSKAKTSDDTSAFENLAQELLAEELPQKNILDEAPEEATESEEGLEFGDSKMEADILEEEAPAMKEFHYNKGEDEIKQEDEGLVDMEEELMDEELLDEELEVPGEEDLDLFEQDEIEAGEDEETYSSKELGSDRMANIDRMMDPDEMRDLKSTMRHMRNERDRLLTEIEFLKKENRKIEQDRLGSKAELEEMKIELSILKKSNTDDVSDLNYKLRLSENKREILQKKLKEYQKEFQRLGQKVRIDFNQVKQREKELEGQLELIKMDSQAQIESRDKKILELKRKIDALEFNMENVSIQEQKSKEDRVKLEERLKKIMKTLRGSIKLLEDDLDIDDELFDNVNNKKTD